MPVLIWYVVKMKCHKCGVNRRDNHSFCVRCHEAKKKLFGEHYDR